jgi:hypothetical protein
VADLGRVRAGAVAVVSLRMRQATGVAGLVVTRWCGGIRLAPAGGGPEHALAQTPIYLTAEDLILLLAFDHGEFGLTEVLDEHVASWAVSRLERAATWDDHDRVIDYWDRQP